jgi:hypothetical protein
MDKGEDSDNVTETVEIQDFIGTRGTGYQSTQS